MNNKSEFLPVPNDLKGALEYAGILAKSQLIPKQFQNRPEDIVVAMMWSHNLNVPVLQGLQGIAIINGRPSIWGDLMIAVCQSSGLLVDIAESFSGSGDSLTATCVVKRKDRETPIVRSFSIEEAKRAGLMNKGPWAQYTKRMLQNRARSYALRDAFPDVLMGMASADEQSDAAAVEMGRAEVVPATPVVLPKPKKTEVTETVEAEIETVEEPEHMPASSVSDIQKIQEAIASAATQEELMAIWKKIPTAVRGTLKHELQTRKKELETKAQAVKEPVAEAAPAPAPAPAPKRKAQAAAQTENAAEEVPDDDEGRLF
ncbi:recombinase RecT [uncultured Parasutterella sp.]|uniref:recombinase RecT n=1 Tax=uncultured Parasutterella sp. TaxID=1263098 RepID=UPI00272ADBFD|nr:recombinase RecT [uncultured Parasutterella sp.]